jgi:hypothetical protein
LLFIHLPESIMTMPPCIERTQRDVAAGNLLLMLSKGDGTGVALTSEEAQVSAYHQLQQETIERLKQKERELEEKIQQRKRKQLELYLAAVGATALPNPMSAAHNTINLSAALIPADLQSFYLNLIAQRGGNNPLVHRVAPDELHHQLQQGTIPYHQMKPLRPLNTSTPEIDERVRVCSPTPPSPPGSPSSNSRNTEETSSLPSLVIPTSNKVPLPQWFKDSKTTVVIGKGHLPRRTPGNQLLRQMVRDRLEDYQQRNRRGRADIVSDIYASIQRLNPDGRYFGNFTLDGEWCEAKEHSARDKIAATFRDCLSHLYKSSTKSKVAKRRKRKAETKQPSSSNE